MVDIFFFTNNQTIRVKSAREYYDGSRIVVEYVTLDGQVKRVKAEDVFVQG
jgi:hypothetical protein